MSSSLTLISSLPTTLPPKLSICGFVKSESLVQSLKELLSGDRYSLTLIDTELEFLDLIKQHAQQIDCLILLEDRSLRPIFAQLSERGTLLPVAILATSDIQSSVLADDSKSTSAAYIYHAGEVRALTNQVNQIERFIEAAIAQFLNLSPSCDLSSQIVTETPAIKATAQNFLTQQQYRLAEKLKERLGYLGVYYKRNPQAFFRNLSEIDKQELLAELTSDYHQIILNYFANDNTINQKIDNYVNTAFMSDISVSQIVEIHMELMGKLAKHLKLEGRNEDILLDYRLTLIDIMAHLCEMYRRSIPKQL